MLNQRPVLDECSMLFVAGVLGGGMDRVQAGSLHGGGRHVQTRVGRPGLRVSTQKTTVLDTCSVSDAKRKTQRKTLRLLLHGPYLQCVLRKSASNASVVSLDRTLRYNLRRTCLRCLLAPHPGIQKQSRLIFATPPCATKFHILRRRKSDTLCRTKLQDVLLLLELLS